MDGLAELCKTGTQWHFPRNWRQWAVWWDCCRLSLLSYKLPVTENKLGTCCPKSKCRLKLLVSLPSSTLARVHWMHLCAGYRKLAYRPRTTTDRKLCWQLSWSGYLEDHCSTQTGCWAQCKRSLHCLRLQRLSRNQESQQWRRSQTNICFRLSMLTLLLIALLPIHLQTKTIDLCHID